MLLANRKVADSLMSKFSGNVENFAIFLHDFYDEEEAVLFINHMKKHPQAMIADFVAFARFLHVQWKIEIEELNELFMPFVLRIGQTGRIHFFNFDDKVNVESPFFRHDFYLSFESALIKSVIRKHWTVCNRNPDESHTEGRFNQGRRNLLDAFNSSIEMYPTANHWRIAITPIITRVQDIAQVTVEEGAPAEETTFVV